ncbi:hypothetical protein FRC15_001716, partial [Serendipita sp. 397]
MSLPSLINGADCGPSNALQSLTKRIDADRGIQSDFFGSGHAGPSTSSFRTVVQGNSQLSGEKSQFFNATRRRGLQGHGPAAFNFREMNQALPKNNHGLPQAQGASLLPEFQESLNKQAGIDGWAAEFLKAGPPGPLQSLPSTRHEVALNQPLHPPGTMDHLMRPAFVPLQMNPLQQPIPYTNVMRPSVAETINWEQQFMQQENLLENNLGQTASNPVPIDGDELSRTAGLLIETLKDEQNPKFQKSEFMDFMRQLRDREMVVEDDKLVPASEAKITSASTSSTKVQGVAPLSASTSTGFRGRINSIESWPMKSVHFDPVARAVEATEESVKEEMSEEDAYWEAENRDYRDYWERASSMPSTSTLPVPLMETMQQREWDQLQESWDSWEATATG